MLALGHVDLLEHVRQEIRSYQNGSQTATLKAPSIYLLDEEYPVRSEAENLVQQRLEAVDGAFENSATLLRHARTLAGERPHSCKVCGKTFSQSGQLVIHMRVHTGDKPYACTRCDKGFTCSKQLKVHMRIHTGDKPYHCEICGKKFGYSHVLKLHQIQHFGCRVYKCTICSRTFDGKKEMEVHIAQHDSVPGGIFDKFDVHHQDDMLRLRPNSTGSTASLSGGDSDDRENSSSPMDLSNPEDAYLPRSQFGPTSWFLPPRRLMPNRPPPPSPFSTHAPYMLPSINTICPDPVEASPDQPLSLVVSKPLISGNPLYPITASLIKDLMAEDRAKFGVRPLIGRAPEPEAATVLPTEDEEGPSQISSPARSESVVSHAAASPASTNNSSYGDMENRCLPLRKRKLYQAISDVDNCSDISQGGSSDRGSVIKFAY